MVVELPNTSKLIELSSDDEPDDELGGEPEEEPEIEEPHLEQSVEDIELAMSGDDSTSSLASAEEPKDDFDLDYDTFRDH